MSAPSAIARDEKNKELSRDAAADRRLAGGLEHAPQKQEYFLSMRLVEFGRPIPRLHYTSTAQSTSRSHRPSMVCAPVNPLFEA